MKITKRWQKDLEEQIIQYHSKYKPKNMLLTSTKPITNNIKQHLENIGIKTIDNLTPHNKNAIEEFKTLIKITLT